MLPNRGDNLIKIGQLAKLAGVLSSTIHFYTQMGLLQFAAETRGGYRLYDKQKSLNRLKQIRDLQEKKRLTIAEIRKYKFKD